MMEKYIATFYSHFGAIRFNRELMKCGITGTVMPVPRDLSSSCGTCVLFAAEGWSRKEKNGELEQLVKVTENGYLCIYRAEHS